MHCFQQLHIWRNALWLRLWRYSLSLSLSHTHTQLLLLVLHHLKRILKRNFCIWLKYCCKLTNRIISYSQRIIPLCAGGLSLTRFHVFLSIQTLCGSISQSMYWYWAVIYFDIDIVGLFVLILMQYSFWNQFVNAYFTERRGLSESIEAISRRVTRILLGEQSRHHIWLFFILFAGRLQHG